MPDQKLLELDARDEFPAEIIREMYGSQLGIQLFFIPEAFNGMGAGAFDLYRICERMARIDVGIATGVLATFLGSEPIAVGGTPEQQQYWMRRIADEGILMAYGATEPAAGSDLAALRSNDGWSPLSVLHADSGRMFRGWWRRDAGCELTIVADPGPRPPICLPPPGQRALPFLSTSLSLQDSGGDTFEGATPWNTGTLRFVGRTRTSRATALARTEPTCSRWTSIER